MSLNEPLDLFKYQIRKMSILNRISILITGLSGYWYLWIASYFDIIENGSFSLALLSILSILIIAGILYLGEDVVESRFISFYRLLCVGGLVFTGLENPNYFPISMIVFIVTILFHYSLEVLRKRLHRTFSITRIYSHETEYESILKSNVIYISDRLTWNIALHGFIFLIGVIIIFLVRLFAYLDTKVIPEISQFVGLLSMFAILFTILRRFYIISSPK